MSITAERHSGMLLAGTPKIDWITAFAGMTNRNWSLIGMDQPQVKARTI